MARRPCRSQSRAEKRPCHIVVAAPRPEAGGDGSASAIARREEQDRGLDTLAAPAAALHHPRGLRRPVRKADAPKSKRARPGAATTGAAPIASAPVLVPVTARSPPPAKAPLEEAHAHLLVVLQPTRNCAGGSLASQFIPQACGSLAHGPDAAHRLLLPQDLRREPQSPWMRRAPRVAAASRFGQRIAQPASPPMTPGDASLSGGGVKTVWVSRRAIPREHHPEADREHEAEPPSTIAASST